MTDKAKIGKNAWKAELAEGRIAADEMGKALDLLLSDPGQNSRGMLIAHAAVALRKMEAALNRLERIGREADDVERARKNESANLDN